MKTPPKILRSILFILSLIVSFFIGYSVQSLPRQQTDEAEFPSRKLQITAQADPSNNGTGFTSGELGGNYNGDLEYLYLSDVNIQINGQAKPLESAIQEGSVTAEEIFAYARLDARNGICEETSDTRNGLTSFIYHYPEFNIKLTYDIYQTPNNGDHLINSILLSDPEFDVSVYTDYIDPNSSLGYKLDREDWGLTMEITDTTAASISVAYTQSGGQQFGNLRLYSYVIMNKQGDILVYHSYSNAENEDYIAIHRDTSSGFTLDWEEGYGSLPAGDYIARILVEDEYDESDIHPFTLKYHDHQPYILYFSVS